MSMSIEPLFAIPLVHIRIPDWDKKKERILKLKSDSLRYYDLENIVTDYHDNPNAYCDEVYDILKNEIKSVYKALGASDYKVDKAWIEVARKDMDHKIHNHGGEGLSCVCYVEYDSRYHTPTHFVSPFGDWNHGLTIVAAPSGIEEGSLIIFPAMLNHFTNPNKCNVERTILSFNLRRV